MARPVIAPREITNASSAPAVPRPGGSPSAREIGGSVAGWLADSGLTAQNNTWAGVYTQHSVARIATTGCARLLHRDPWDASARSRWHHYGRRAQRSLKYVKYVETRTCHSHGRNLMPISIWEKLHRKNYHRISQPKNGSTFRDNSSPSHFSHVPFLSEKVSLKYSPCFSNKMFLGEINPTTERTGPPKA